MKPDLRATVDLLDCKVLLDLLEKREATVSLGRMESMENLDPRGAQETQAFGDHKETRGQLALRGKLVLQVKTDRLVLPESKVLRDLQVLQAPRGQREMRGLPVWVGSQANQGPLGPKVLMDPRAIMAILVPLVQRERKEIQWRLQLQHRHLLRRHLSI